MVFDNLDYLWDEAVPMGNGMVGQLLWQNDGKLRLSLDRADLWDLRPMANIDFRKWKFSDVYQRWKDNTYREVQKAFDVPYDKLPATPADWKNVSFDQLRTYGAFLISANKENGLVRNIKIVSEKGGLIRLQNPFPGKFKTEKDYQLEGENIVIEMKEGEIVNLKPN
ncbi:MAG: glycoside hydrolase family 95-like protein [Mangrovibacterium sp.]